jgi:hypothetical protein
MTSGSICEIVGSSRLLGGFHGVWTCSGVFPAMRSMMIKKIPRVAALWAWLCFGAKSL